MNESLIKEFEEWIQETDKGLYDGGWNFGDDDFDLFNRIKEKLKD